MKDCHLVWTSKGYIPFCNLQYKTHWNISEDRIEFIEEHWMQEECVKRAVHIKLLKMPENMNALAGKLEEATHG